MNIAVLDFNKYEVTKYNNIELKGDLSDSELAEQFLIKYHNLDEIEYMLGEEYIEVNELEQTELE